MTSTAALRTHAPGHRIPGHRVGRRDQSVLTRETPGNGHRNRGESRGTGASNEVRELVRLIGMVRRTGVAQVLADLGGSDVDGGIVAAVAAECTFDHAAMLLYPDDVGSVARFLRACGFDLAAPVPSVIVRDRLARRYAVSADKLDVSILKGSIRSDSGGDAGIEVFCLPRGRATPEMMARERHEKNESHVALMVNRPAMLTALRSVFLGPFGMLPDGGGYNPHDGARTGGRTALYFHARGGRRLELTCAGNHVGRDTVPDGRQR